MYLTIYLYYNYMIKLLKNKESKILISGLQTGILTFFMLGFCLLFTTPNIHKFNNKNYFDTFIDIIGSFFYIFTGVYNLSLLY